MAAAERPMRLHPLEDDSMGRRRSGRPGRDALEEDIMPTENFVHPPVQKYVPDSSTSFVPSKLGDRDVVRSMWEFGSILSFFQVFRDALLLDVEFSADELESALLNPGGSMLKDLHVALLKGVPPVTRPPADRTTWATVLCKKLINMWGWVDEGLCPLQMANGQEEEMYRALHVSDRVRILKALCELRLDQEDVRNHIDFHLRHKQPIQMFQMTPLGSDSAGGRYWHADDHELGHRLYWEGPATPNKGRGGGRKVPPPSAGKWETVATNHEEFAAMGEKLAGSRHRGEMRVGRHIKEVVLPTLEEIERKRERQLKKQQRHAVMLDGFLNGAGLAAGRSRRERKAVSYTFDDYERSINDAIRVTKKGRQLSPEAPGTREGLRGHTGELIPPENFVPPENVIPPESEIPPESSEPEFPDQPLAEPSNGHVHEDEPAPQLEEAPDIEPPQADADEAAILGTSLRSGRTSKKPTLFQAGKYNSVPPDMVDEEFMDDADDFSDDNIEGEVVYKDEFLRAQKKRKKEQGADSEEDEEYKVSDAEEDNDEGEDFQEGAESASGDDSWGEDVRSSRARKPKRTRAPPRGRWASVPDSSNLRRSSRSTRNTVDYSKLDGSDAEGEGDDRSTRAASGRASSRSQRRPSRMAVYEEDEWQSQDDGEDEVEDEEGREWEVAQRGRRRGSSRYQGEEEEQHYAPPAAAAEEDDSTGGDGDDCANDEAAHQRLTLDLNKEASSGERAHEGSDASEGEHYAGKDSDDGDEYYGDRAHARHDHGVIQRRSALSEADESDVGD